MHNIKTLQIHVGNVNKKRYFMFNGYVKKLENVEFKYIADLEDFKD